MEIIEFDYLNPPKLENTCVCLGYFDGVHLGHKKIVEAAKKEGYKVAVLTFDKSPNVVLKKYDQIHQLSSIADKADYFGELGVDYLLLLHFDLETSRLSKESFAEMLKKIGAHKFFVGEDYRFGYLHSGTNEYLKTIVDLEVVPFELLNGEKISSSKIMQDLLSGDIESANKKLGRNYRVEGLVVPGLKNGRSIGFQTANLDLGYDYVMPKAGAYYGYAIIRDEKYKCIISVGTHPTISHLSSPIVEVHVIDFDDELYGNYIFAEFVGMIREEQTFDNLEELKLQLEKDKEFAKKQLR